jgi:enoyl-CoA hydratase
VSDVVLAEAVGLRRARELSATGSFLPAGQALAWGLVNHVAEHEPCFRLPAR